MKKNTFLFLLALGMVITSIHAKSSRKIFPAFRVSSQEWKYDSLGNHRAVVNVTKGGVVAKVEIPWRRRDMEPETKQLRVFDGQTQQRITNVKVLENTREKGVVLFEPSSGKGVYYIYYMPYFSGGSTYYPNVQYYPVSETASVEWLKKVAHERPVRATVSVLEAVNDFNSFFPMEIIATKVETDKLLSRYKKNEFLVFPEDRMHSIRMRRDLPQRWIEKGLQATFSDTADRGENFAYQLGVFPVKHELKNLKVTYSNLRSKEGGLISKDLIQCINTTGVNWMGQPQTCTVNVPPREVQPIWTVFTIPEDARPGIYEGKAVMSAEGVTPVAVNICLTVTDKLADNHGVKEPWKQTRLTWLNSTIGETNTVISPYTPLRLEGDVLHLLGRDVKIAKNGLPAQLTSFFTEEMTEIGTIPKNFLYEGMHFHVNPVVGKEIKFESSPLEIKEQSDGMIAWRVRNEAPEMEMLVDGLLEFDGFMDFRVAVVARRDLQLKDINFHIPVMPDAAPYFMGLGEKGGVRNEFVRWKWDVTNKNQEGAWLGDVNAGLQFSLRDENYQRPLNTNFYLQKPLILPKSWGNDGKGGVDVGMKGSSMLVHAYSGERMMKTGDTLYYNVKLLFTPFHPLQTDWQWSSRFLHKHVPIDTVKSLGATVVNIHQGTTINPYINYPFLKNKELKNYIDSAHSEGIKVKIYNTVRELSNRAYELPALFSLRHEIFSEGKGGGYSWLQEHLDGDYIAAWYTPETNDAAIVNSGMSRWHNYYVEGLRWLTQQIGIDGIYLDDVAFDRNIMKRIKRVMTEGGHDGLIDLHSANQFNKRDGFNNSANLYMELFPYLNRLWFGEYFDYENNSPAFYLTEVSGIPYGLMGEMLEKNGNLYRGMLYGMTNRLLWNCCKDMPAADPHPVWNVMDAFGMQGSKMIGYWVKTNPVKTNNPDVPVTIYKKDKALLIALASWAKEEVAVTLSIDWNALGMNPEKAVLKAIGAQGLQPEGEMEPNKPLVVSPNKGWLLTLTEK